MKNYDREKGIYDRHSSLIIVTGLSRNYYSISVRGKSLFFTASSLPLGPTRPPIQYVLLSPLTRGTIRLGHGSSEVKNVYSFTSTPPYILMCLYSTGTF
jgi:hypothetical protein